MAEVDACLDNEQAAGFLGVAPQTLAVWRMQGRGPEFYKVDRRVRYSMAALEDFRRALEAVRGPKFRKMDFKDSCVTDPRVHRR